MFNIFKRNPAEQVLAPVDVRTEIAKTNLTEQEIQLINKYSLGNRIWGIYDFIKYRQQSRRNSIYSLVTENNIAALGVTQYNNINFHEGIASFLGLMSWRESYNRYSVIEATNAYLHKHPEADLNTYHTIYFLSQLDNKYAPVKRVFFLPPHENGEEYPTTDYELNLTLNSPISMALTYFVVGLEATIPESNYNLLQWREMTSYETGEKYESVSGKFVHSLFKSQLSYVMDPPVQTELAPSQTWS